MRGLIVFIIVAATSVADAKRLVMMEPSIVYNCPRGKTWDVVATCLAKIGKPTVLKSDATSRLVMLTGSQANGLFLYVQRKTGWQIGGLYEGAGLDVLSFAPVTINRHAGHRIEVGQTIHTSVNRDDGSASPAIMRLAQTLYCGGDSYACASVVTLCEVFVGGKAIGVFRGTLSVEEQNIVRVDGDRTRTGPACQVGDRAFLGWSPNP